jgi:hypothetical protein
MELTIATLNEVLLPPFLFIVVFCFLCCQLPQTRYTTATDLPEIEPIAIPQQKTEPYSVEEILQADVGRVSMVEEPATPSPQPDTPAEELENVPALEEALETVTVTEPVSSQQTEVYAQALAAIDNLGKREARKLMGGLKLQQKRNGVELSTELMVASIKREFKVEPDRVIEAIRLRLPELLSNAATSQPDQLAS